MATVLPVPNRKDLAQVFIDPKTQLMIEQLLKQLGSVVPSDISQLQKVNYVTTVADATTPNAHVITAGSGISIAIAAGSVTITALNGPFGFGFDRDLGVALPVSPFVEFATEIQYTLAAGLSNSIVLLQASGTAATATTVFDLQIGGTSVGSITFAAGSHTAVLTMAANHTVTPGTTVQVVAPASLNGMTGRLYGSVVGVRG